MIRAFLGDVEIWRQPIVISQNRYQSNLLNSWDGRFVIDEDENYILSAMMGAGKKDSSNRFSGVLMGDVGTKSENDGLIGKIGLYGYHEGAQSFGFDIDGKAFLGKSGNGRIIFDGNNGYIGSSHWFNTDGSVKADAEEGMLIDLQNGYINAYNFKLKSKNITMKSIPDDNDDAYFEVRVNRKEGQDEKAFIHISNNNYYL
jgi:hypothetical protein